MARVVRDSRRTLRAGCLCLAAVFGLAAGRANAESVLLADGRQIHNVTLREGPTPEQVRLDRRDEAPLIVGRDEVLVAEFHRTPGLARPFAVELVNGDRLLGEVSFPAPRQLRLGTAWGSAIIPFQWVSACRLVDDAVLPPPREQDVVVVDTTGPASGEIRKIENGKLILDRNGTSIPIDLARVEGFVLHRREPPESPLRGLIVAVDLGGGERLTARWIGVRESTALLQTVWGQDLEVRLASLSRLEVKNGKLVYLSELTPVNVVQASYFGGDYPYRVGMSQGGRPLRVAGQVYRHGLGVHSRCSLTYALEGAFARFSAVVGLDDEVGAAGSVVFRVYGDDRLLYESPLMRGSDPPQELEIDVSRVIALRLEVDYADLADLADHADWADARLLRP